MTANIVQFPEAKIVRKFPEFQEALKKEGELRGVEEFSEGLVAHIYEFLTINGISGDVFEERDFHLISESVKGAVYRKFGLQHTIHEMIDVAYVAAKDELALEEQSGNTD